MVFDSAHTSLRSKTLSTWRRESARIVLSLVVLFAVALAVSSGFNAIALYYFRHPPPGQMYMVNGHKMRIDCSSPTIVLDAGGGADGLMLTACCSDRRRHAGTDRWIWQARPLRIKWQDWIGSSAHLVKMTEKSLKSRKLQNPPPELYVCDLIRRLKSATD
jgi:hypothetical protein